MCLFCVLCCLLLWQLRLVWIRWLARTQQWRFCYTRGRSGKKLYSVGRCCRIWQGFRVIWIMGMHHLQQQPQRRHGTHQNGQPPSQPTTARVPIGVVCQDRLKPDCNHTKTDQSGLLQLLACLTPPCPLAAAFPPAKKRAPFPAPLPPLLSRCSAGSV